MKLDKTKLLIACIFSTIGFLLFLLFIDSLQVWFTRASSINSFDSVIKYVNWYFPIPITALLIGLFFPNNSLKNRILFIGSIVLFLFSSLGLISGLTFTMTIAKEEYVLHFLFVQTYAILYAFGLGLVISFLIGTNDRGSRNLVITFSISFILGALVGFCFNVIAPSQILERWIGVCVLTGAAPIFFYLHHKKSSHENH